METDINVISTSIDYFGLVVLILSSAIQYGTPILYGTLGAIVMERSGVSNLGVEGMMMISAFAAFLGMYLSGSAVVGLFCGAMAGMLACGLHGVICLIFQGSQVVSGLALTIFGVGLANYLGTPFIGKITSGFTTWALPGLSSIPLLGPIFFQQDALVYLSYILPVLLWFMLMRTRFGLSIRAVGENPSAVRSAGLSPYFLRWAAILIGGAIVGMGGAYLSLCAVHIWTNNLSAGRGWIAVALVIFAFWRPGRAVLGAWLFGCIVTFSYRLQALDIKVPSSILDMMPYILTLVVLLVSSVMGKGRAAPAALTINLEPEE